MSSRALSPPSQRRAVLALSLLACLTGCGGTRPVAPTAQTHSSATPALLRTPRASGEVVLHGDASPATHGPFALHGRYLVRFVQYAPEDPVLDFSQQTAFVVLVHPAAGSPRTPGIRLFRSATRTGRREIRLHGRYRVEVSFGDFPYVVRFTPQAG